MAIKERTEILEQDKWDLTKLFKTVKDWEDAFETSKELVDDVVSYKGKIMESSDTLCNFYLAYDKMNRLVDKVYLYAKMECDTDTTNPEYKARKALVEKLVDDLLINISFCTPEILSADYSLVLKYIEENPKLNDFKFDLEKMFRYKEHTLSEAEEELISKANNALGTGRDVFYNFDNADIKLGSVIDDDGNEVEVTNSN